MAFQEQRRARQPVPDVSEDDVERIIRRDFPSTQFESAIAILKQYGADKWDRENSRVRLAALKLANGNLASLEKHIAAAKKDYRDVLVAAEYPAYGKVGFRATELPKKEHQQIVDADWAISKLAPKVIRRSARRD